MFFLLLFGRLFAISRSPRCLWEVSFKFFIHTAIMWPQSSKLSNVCENKTLSIFSETSHAHTISVIFCYFSKLLKLKASKIVCLHRVYSFICLNNLQSLGINDSGRGNALSAVISTVISLNTSRLIWLLYSNGFSRNCSSIQCFISAANLLKYWIAISNANSQIDISGLW